MVQWWRICLPMQGTQVQYLFGEPRSHMPRGYWVHKPQRDHLRCNQDSTQPNKYFLKISFTIKRIKRAEAHYIFFYHAWSFLFFFVSFLKNKYSLALPGFHCSTWDLHCHEPVSCSKQDLVPWPGIEPRPQAWERGVLATGPPGKSLRFPF